MAGRQGPAHKRVTAPAHRRHSDPSFASTAATSPALSTRGLGTGEMDQVADLIHTVLTHTRPVAGSKARYTLDAALAAKLSQRAADLLAPFPLYPTIDLG
ncbi:hypothetical protein K1W54_18455 [Micromonospora sp. CPCC 205371]|nr:hypothetical protein [Micromonospora sp. CPCC 205371]